MSSSILQNWFMGDSDHASVSEIYKIVRGQIEHVANNLGQRVIWMVIAQSFFFSGYAILINGKVSDQKLLGVYHAMVKLIPVAGLLTVVFTYIDVISSIVQMKKLRKSFENGPGKKQADEIHFPSINATQSERIFMHASPVMIPIVFIIIWIILIVA